MIRECAHNLLTALNSPRNMELDSALESLSMVGHAGALDTHREEQFDILFTIAEDLRRTSRPTGPVNCAPGRRAAITDILRQLSLGGQL